MTTSRPIPDPSSRYSRGRIGKNRRGLRERHAVLREIRRSLGRVPFKVAIEYRWHRMNDYGP